jgi:Leucine-rich repeat (LRR) protein
LEQLASSITYLDIMNNGITDEGSKSIIKLKKLTHLYIGWNKLTYLGVRWVMKDLRCLEALDARFNILNNEDKEKIKS